MSPFRIPSITSSRPSFAGYMRQAPTEDLVILMIGLKVVFLIITCHFPCALFGKKGWADLHRVSQRSSLQAWQRFYGFSECGTQPQTIINCEFAGPLTHCWVHLRYNLTRGDSTCPARLLDAQGRQNQRIHLRRPVPPGDHAISVSHEH